MERRNGKHTDGELVERPPVTEEAPPTGSTYCAKWIWRVAPAGGRLRAEGFCVGPIETESGEGSLRLEVGEDERIIPDVQEAITCNGVAMVYRGRQWEVERWHGSKPTEDEQTRMWKEFAAHKAQHLKGKKRTASLPSRGERG